MSSTNQRLPYRFASGLSLRMNCESSLRPGTINAESLGLRLTASPSALPRFGNKDSQPGWHDLSRLWQSECSDVAHASVQMSTVLREPHVQCFEAPPQLFQCALQEAEVPGTSSQKEMSFVPQRFPQSSVSCNCLRPTCLVKCSSCGHHFTGRVRRLCLLHPTQIFLMDIEICPRCKASSLIEYQK